MISGTVVEVIKMKLRGEKELLADKLYNSIEEELYKTIVGKGKIIKQSVDTCVRILTTV